MADVNRPWEGWYSPIPPPPYVFEEVNQLVAVMMDTPGMPREQIVPMLRRMREVLPPEWNNAPFKAVAAMIEAALEV